MHYRLALSPSVRTGCGFVEKFFTEWFAGDIVHRLDDFELTAGQGLADESVINQVVVFLHGDLACRTFKFLANQGFADFIHLKGARLLDGLFPQVDANARQVHWAAGHAAFAIDSADFVLDAGDFWLFEPGHEVFYEFAV